jgi:ferric-dicitrate binding protein FerR (iron transport regulator)
MEKEYFIKKWLDNDLSAQELEAFKQLEDYKSLVQLNNDLQAFKTAKYNTEAELEKVLSRIEHTQNKQSWIKPLLRIAAVLVIGFSIYFYTSSLNTTVSTLAANKTNIVLPDQSTVDLNSKSTLVYNKKSWKKEREVTLNGEAYFRVAKGSTFDVNTQYGTVTVLGTQFNVKQRDSYFEVICYEGLVSVSYKSKETKLKPGSRFLMIHGKVIATEKESNDSPSWLNNTSTFKSIPLQYVLNELERQYNVTIEVTNIDTSKLYTGSFSHDNLEIALKSVTLPFNLQYSINNNTITLKRG